MSNTPFFDAIAAVAARGPRFFVPGHKGNPAAVPALGALLHYDLTEVEGACDLSHPAGALAQSEQNMARVYGAGATLYTTFGASACVAAMLALYCAPGGGLVMARGAHAGAIKALALLDVAPVWVPLHGGVPVAADIGAALEKSGAGAVYITTVDYYGRVPDVAAIAAVCRRHGARLLCDNAQGAHLRFFERPDGGSRHPLALGADAVADSAHKSLPCLTGAALLHLADGTLAPRARAALNLFSGTSPAYPVLLSLDLAAGRLLDDAPDFAAAAAALDVAAAPAAGLRLPSGDPLRLVLCPAMGGLAPETFHAGLLAAGIAPEYYDGEVLVLLAGPFNTPGDLAALRAALEKLAAGTAAPARLGAPGPRRGDPVAETLPKTACGVRAALFGPKRAVAAAGAAGRVCAGLYAPCPPGVPPVLPGEVISPAAAALLRDGGVSHMDVVK